MMTIERFFKFAAFAACLLCFASCDDDEAPIPEIEVTSAYLDGTWTLTEWNGAPLADGLYLYITFDRRERTYEMYHNFDSMYARFITGSYKIGKDDNLDFVISGDYDYGNGEWNNEYAVVARLDDEMVWTAKDSGADTQRFIRCIGIPDGIIAEAGADEDMADTDSGTIPGGRVAGKDVFSVRFFKFFK